MAKFIKLIKTDENSIYINVDHIIAILPMPYGCFLSLAGNYDSLDVKETSQEMFEKMAEKE